ncbi:MAG: hypothetical protein R3A48_03020 [Polyangiales bacterium]
MKVEACHDLRAFFRQQLTLALTRRRIDARPETEAYIAGVLVDCGMQPPRLDRPLVVALNEALACESALRTVRLMRTGDAALCLAGLFAPHVERTVGSLGLYIHLGSMAYQRAADASRGDASPPAPVDTLAELGEGFPRFVDALHEVAESSALGAVTRDVVRLYDRLRAAGSERAAEEMARQGLFPAPGAKGTC